MLVRNGISSRLESAPLPASNQASFPTFQSRKLYKSISGTIPFSVFQIFPLPVSPNKCKYRTYTSYCCVTLLSIDIGQHMSKHLFSHCNLVSRLYDLRSVRNLHHRIALLRADKDVYNVDLLWIKDSEVIECQSHKNLIPVRPNHETP